MLAQNPAPSEAAWMRRTRAAQEVAQKVMDLLSAPGLTGTVNLNEGAAWAR
jgi:hypothetical protein